MKVYNIMNSTANKIFRTFITMLKLARFYYFCMSTKLKVIGIFRSIKFFFINSNNANFSVFLLTFM